MSHLILRHCRAKVVKPPHISTVVMTITSVAVNINCRSSDCVFLIARANAMAPLRPEEREMNSVINKTHLVTHQQILACVEI